MKEIKNLLAVAIIAFVAAALVLLWSEFRADYGVVTIKLFTSMFIIFGTLLAKEYGKLK